MANRSNEKKKRGRGKKSHGVAKRTTTRRRRRQRRTACNGTVVDARFWKQPPCADVSWNSRTRCFMGHGKRCKGLTKYLSKFMYPGYVFGGKAGAAGRTGIRGFGKSAVRAGMRRGNTVDKQVGNTIRYIATKNMSFGTLMCDSRLATYRNRWHSYTRALMVYLISKRWYPVCAQLPVVSSPATVATAIDLLCWSLEHKSYVLVEIKTGYAGWYTAGNKRLAHAPKHNNGPYSQHQLQLAGTLLMFQQTYPCVSIGSACVLRVHAIAEQKEPIVTMYPLQAWASTAIASALYAQSHTTSGAVTTEHIHEQSPRSTSGKKRGRRTQEDITLAGLIHKYTACKRRRRHRVD